MAATIDKISSRIGPITLLLLLVDQFGPARDRGGYGDRKAEKNRPK